MRWPRQELQTARPLRTSPLYDRLRAAGAVFGSKFGWERANYFLEPGQVEPLPTLHRPGWLPNVIAEQRATREAVTLYDQTSFGKLLVQGRDALALLQRVCAADVDVPVDRMVYSAMLNAHGGFESDLTVIRLGPERFLLVTGSAQPVRDADHLRRNRLDGEEVVIDEVTGAWAVLSVMGPQAPQLLSRVSPDDLSPAALPARHTREIDVGHARVRAARMSYVGGPGYELYVPVETARHVDQALRDAADGLGLRDAGYYALDALRIEAGRRAWGAELGPDETPAEAGLWAGVSLDKPVEFIGRGGGGEGGEGSGKGAGPKKNWSGVGLGGGFSLESRVGFLGLASLRPARGQPLRKRLVTVVLDDPLAWCWGGEPIHLDGQPVGELTSAGWGWRSGRCVALGYVRGTAAQASHDGRPVTVECWGEPVAARAHDRWPP